MSEQLVEELQAAPGVSAWKDGWNSVGREAPDDASVVKSFDGLVPLGKRNGELKVELEVVSPPGLVVLEVAGKGRGIGDGDKDEISKAKSV